MRLLALAVLAIAAPCIATSPAGGSGPTRTITLTVTEREYSVALSRHVVPVGARVRFVVSNQGAVNHEAVLELAGSVDHPLRDHGRATELEAIPPGGSKQAAWILTRPGRYQIACHVPGHYRKGMVQAFTVVAS
jgi:uncharacterized cupredoxin-like copper-binding protein